MTTIHKNKIDSLTKYSLWVMVGFGLLAILIGLYLTPSISQIIEEMGRSLIRHGRSDSESLSVQYPGAVFVAAGLVVWCMAFSYYWFKVPIRGIQWAVVGQVFGFSFTSLTLFNLWPTVIGVLLLTKLKNRSVKDYLAIAWFSVALAPFVSTLAFHTPELNPGSPRAIIVSYLVGIVLGILVGQSIDYVRDFLQGRILFVNGAATGLVAWFVYNIMKTIGLHQEPLTDQVYLQDANAHYYPLFMLLMVYLMIAGFYYTRSFKSYRQELLWTTTEAGDYVTQFGLGNALINMGLVGAVGLTYIVLIPGAQIKGPMLAALFTVTGFAAAGITLKSMLPLWLGVWFGYVGLGGVHGWLTGTGSISEMVVRMGSMRMSTVSLYVLGLSPVVHRYGFWSAFVAGAIHSTNVMNTGQLTGWMQSYNNGFSEGLVVTLFYPFWSYFGRRQTKAKNSTTS